MKQIATMICHGHYKVMYDDKAKYNPFKVYHIRDGHRKKIHEYADLGSAMMKLSNLADMWGTIERIEQ